MNPIKTLPLVASLFLLGCETTQWVKHGDPSANLERDQYECKRDAFGMVRTPNAVAAPGPNIPSTYSTNCNMLGSSAYCNTTQTNSYTQALIAQSNQQTAQGWAELGASIERQNIISECMRSKGWTKEVVQEGRVVEEKPRIKAVTPSKQLGNKCQTVAGVLVCE